MVLSNAPSRHPPCRYPPGATTNTTHYYFVNNKNRSSRSMYSNSDNQSTSHVNKSNSYKEPLTNCPIGPLAGGPFSQF